MALTPSATDKFTKVGEPGSATTLSAPGYTIGDTTINVAATTNWSTDTKVIFAIDRAEVANGVEVRVSGTYNEYEGIVTGSGVITSLDHRLGTDQDYAAGSLTRVYIPVAATRENDMVEGLNQDHNGKGNHKTLTDDNGNEWLERGSVSGAVNHLKSQNATTGNAPAAEAAGGDTNIDLRLKAKGTGTVQSGRPVAFRAYLGSAATLASGERLVPLDAEQFDYGSNFDTSNNEFTAPYDGVYHIDAGIRITDFDDSGDIMFAYVYKNGTDQVLGGENEVVRNSLGDISVNISSPIELAAGDTLQLWVNHSSDSSESLTTGIRFTYLAGHLIGRTD